MRKAIIIILSSLLAIFFISITVSATANDEATFFSDGYCLPINSSNYNYVGYNEDIYSQYTYGSSDNLYHYEIANRLNDGTMLYERNIYAVSDGTAYAINGGLILVDTSGEWMFIYSYSNTFNGLVFEDRFSVPESNAISVTAGEKIGALTFDESTQYEETLNTNDFFFAAYYQEESYPWYDLFVTITPEGSEENPVEDVTSEFSEEAAIAWDEAYALVLEAHENLNLDEASIFSKLAANIFSKFVDLLNLIWGLMVINLTDESYIEAAENVTNTLIVFFTPIAFAFSVLFWTIGVLNLVSKENIELETKENAIKYFGSIIFIALWINTASWFCREIISLNSGIVKTLLANSEDVLTFSSEESQLSLGLFLIYIITVLVVIVVAFMISVKLIIRQLELIALTSVSPIFFGCCVSDVTKPYFWRFARTFIGTTLETTYMAVIYIVGMRYWNVNGSLYDGFADSECLGTMILAISIGIMIFSPPKAFKNILGV